MSAIITEPITQADQNNSPNSFAKQLIAFSFLTLILLTATGVFTRFDIASMLWILIYAGSAIYILIDQKQFCSVIKHSWPAFLLPLFALISTFWSEVPIRSLYASTQLIITTLIAIWIGSRFSAITIFKSLLLATAFGVFISILNDYFHFVNIPQPIHLETGQAPSSGIYNQKNVYGNAIKLLTISLIIIGIKYRKLPIAIFLGLLLWFPLSSTQSASSILIYLVTMMLPIYWWLAGKTSKQLVLFLFCTVLSLTTIFLLIILDIGLVDRVLQNMGKDSTLTGRTYLWAVGIEIFKEHPLTGVGYQAFWQPGAFDQVLVIYATFYGQTLNGFHSSFIEVLVALGIFGLFIFVYLLLATLFRSVIWFQKQGSAESFGVMFFILSTIIAATFEPVLFRQHGLYYILMITFYVISKNSVLKKID